MLDAHKAIVFLFVSWISRDGWFHIAIQLDGEASEDHPVRTKKKRTLLYFTCYYHWYFENVLYFRQSIWWDVVVIRLHNPTNSFFNNTAKRKLQEIPYYSLQWWQSLPTHCSYIGIELSHIFEHFVQQIHNWPKGVSHDLLFNICIHGV